ncbi:penicillin-binding protein 2 [Patescibacteria group bacterium]|nr:MAG: penicillin-binding protein 2 [Patescibacteria group bacterium]
MRFYRHNSRVKKDSRQTASGPRNTRFGLLYAGFLLAALVLAFRLFMLQVVSHSFYEALASNAHEIFSKLTPERGSIFLRDQDGKLYPAAANRDTFVIFAEPRAVKQPEELADLLAPMLVLEREELLKKLTSGGWYAPLARGVPEDLANQISDLLKEKNLKGIRESRESARYYPEPAMGGQVIGFVGSNEKGERSGRYGLEGYWNKELAGSQGFIAAETDIAGRWIPAAGRTIAPAANGAELVLTVDRTVQFTACQKLKDAVSTHGADSGSLVILEPATGDLLAMCSAPDFDPNNYSAVSDFSIFNNPAISGQYEPGSVMKAITMAAALDRDQVTPKSTYTDTGEVKLGPFTIKNSDGKAHGVQTMTQVLEESLNTGAIYAQRLIGTETFRGYLEKFGFGEATGIELAGESDGDIAALKKKGEIFGATASYGQGITVTPLQLAAAFGAVANGGNFVAPTIISEIRWSETNVERRQPKIARQVISPKTAAMLGGMLVAVVENGHGKRAGVPGYWVAGKTGTAQVPKKDGPGYLADVTIGTFTGFFPVENPKFAMVVRIDHPRDVQFAESTAAPLFGEIAKFLLQYYHIPPTRPVK